MREIHMALLVLGLMFVIAILIQIARWLREKEKQS